MRKAALLACLSMLATALAAQTGTTDKFANQSDRSLRIQLLPPSPQTHQPLRYRLSEPAYVAAFMIYPGSGVRQLYPLVGAPERLQRAGYNSNQLIGRSFDGDSYRVVPEPGVSGPAYLYVIASRHPLDVARYVHRPMRLASTIGDVDARSFYASVAFDALVKNAISLGDDKSWDADVYVVWPEEAAYSQRTSAVLYKLIVCRDGAARAVPFDYPFTGCAGDSRVLANSDAVKPAVQQAATVAPAPSGGIPGLAGSFAAPTVLPTIIGKRVAEADRGAPGPQGNASKPVMFTMANGDQATPDPSVKVAPGVQIELMDGGYGHARRSDRSDRGDRVNGRRQASDRTNMNGHADGRRQALYEQGQVVGRSPQLAPNPRLAPDPTLAPAPFAAPAARNESQPSAVRESMRVPPAPPSPPRGALPTARP